MPVLARWYIKTALVYLVVALLVGVASQVVPVVFLPDRTMVHLFALGWLTQLIFGVAFWLFPRHSREQPFGKEHLARVAYVFLNVGLILRTLAEPLYFRDSEVRVWGYALAVAALLQWLGGLAFTVYLWPRIKLK